MAAPVKVLEALARGDYGALARMRKKAGRTRAAKKERRKDAAEKLAAEIEAAEDWYKEQREAQKLKELKKEPWIVRRDHLLPPDQL